MGRPAIRILSHYLAACVVLSAVCLAAWATGRRDGASAWEAFCQMTIGAWVGLSVREFMKALR